jgi:hypothetical protein
MQSYLVTLDFSIAFAECDPTEGQTPPGTPEEIADINPELKLVLNHEEDNERKTRYYHCEVDFAAENDDTARLFLIDTFKHLAGFEVVAVTTEPIEHPAARTATKEYVVVCHFRSTEAYFRLNNAFYAHFEEDALFFKVPGKPGHYVAYVVMHAPMSDGLEKTVEALLRDTFEAHSPETADRFTEATTNLL